MKPAVMAVIVGGVFVGGIGVGVLLNAGGGEGAAPNRTPSAPTRTPGTAPPRVTFDGGSVADPNAVAQGPDGAQDPGAAAPTREPAPPPPGTFVGGAPPPGEPPPLPPGALDAEAELRREQAEFGERGNGRVTNLVYDFESEEERQAWEERYKQRWEARLQHEIEIKLKVMREKVGLQAHQETELRKILQAEYEERSRLVGQLTAKQISRSAFDDGVRANVAKAKAALKALLTPEQYVAYGKLKPREQVLEQESK